MTIRVREMTTEERATIEQLAKSRTEQAWRVERARMVLCASEGMRAPAIAEQVNKDVAMVRLWLKRFNQEGLAGLEDRPRSGRPRTYTAEAVGDILAAALTPPQDLNLPFASWTLDRLEVYANEQKGIPMKRSRIQEVLVDEGLRWRSQETWFGERVDPDFAKKRGSLSNSTRSRQRVVS